MEKPMKRFSMDMRNEEGSMIVAALMILVILTIMGIMGTSTSNTELQIASNDQFYKITFYAAEAGRGWAAANRDFYHDENVTVGGNLTFPDTADASVREVINPRQSFNGWVGYLGGTSPPRGSGYEAGKFKAHRYAMDVTGYGPRGAETEVEAGFYRIGF